ncbi:sugar ABC transporter ATP-binding protein [Oribacterium sp. oral taxon 108]|uniref:sugar ABC transporter ATP-binding protein n=1 Tax=Oribacterium sp. oral taxon 108 TaxID=712414 RepID=UPI00020DD85D|nr:sugar ABC transporter ATP-binding protein [Oribacterium sp. oral taxon 108]EGL36298.1 AlsA ABC superfamily (atp_bind), allose transport protein (second module) [Oribacterium sp. oral taxon 108 str. F0425]
MNIVEMRNINKSFPGVKALSNISFSVKPGEVHVLLGENGAGKSTLMKVLSGVYHPDSGSIVLNGVEHSKLNPRLSREGGISIIYQELSVVNWLDIRENIFMGRMQSKKIGPVSTIDYAKLNQDTKKLLKQVNLDKYEPNKMASELSISEKQMLEIAKAISFDAKCIVMDEPTSSLTESEVKKLFEIIRDLKSKGIGIVFISHKLSEIKEIGDRISILKDGNYVGTWNVSDLSEEDMVRLMVGRELEKSYQEGHGSFGEVVFEVKNLSRKDGKVQDFHMQVRKGEIVGLSGLVGAGRSEAMEAIFGAVPKTSGEILLEGKRLTIHTPYDALKNGIGLVTENRRETGFFQNFSNKRNISIASLLKKSKFGGVCGLIQEKNEKEMAEKAKLDLQIKWAGDAQLTKNLSGGNQQKVILGKWISAGVKVLIFDEPTKGIDVGTKSEIYKMMRRLAESGIIVIVVSSEMPELLAVCDRIMVMAEGKVRGEFDIAEATEEKLAMLATGNGG